MNEAIATQFAVSLVSLIVGVFALKKVFTADINSKIEDVKKEAEVNKKDINEKFKTERASNKENLDRLDENTNKYLGIMIDLVRENQVASTLLLTKMLEAQEKNTEKLKDDLDRRFKDVCYKDYCIEKHIGQDKVIEAIHRRLDDICESLGVQKKRG